MISYHHQWVNYSYLTTQYQLRDHLVDRRGPLVVRGDPPDDPVVSFTGESNETRFIRYHKFKL
jgi:hypothetical protein